MDVPLLYKRRSPRPLTYSTAVVAVVLPRCIRAAPVGQCSAVLAARWRDWIHRAARSGKGWAVDWKAAPAPPLHQTPLHRERRRVHGARWHTGHGRACAHAPGALAGWPGTGLAHGLSSCIHAPEHCKPFSPRVIASPMPPLSWAGHGVVPRFLAWR